MTCSGESFPPVLCFSVCSQYLDHEMCWLQRNSIPARQLDCWEFNSKVSHVHYAQCLQSVLVVSITSWISLLLAVTKAGNSRCKLPITTTEEEEEEKHTVSENLAAAEETGVDAAVGAVLSELNGSFTSKEEQNMALKAFLSGQHVSTSLLTGFGKRFVITAWRIVACPRAVTHLKCHPSLQ